MEKELIYSKKLACVVKFRRMKLITETEFLLIKNKLTEDSHINQMNKSA